MDRCSMQKSGSSSSGQLPVFIPVFFHAVLQCPVFIPTYHTITIMYQSGKGTVHWLENTEDFYSILSVYGLVQIIFFLGLLLPVCVCEC